MEQIAHPVHIIYALERPVSKCQITPTCVTNFILLKKRNVDRSLIGPAFQTAYNVTHENNENNSIHNAIIISQFAHILIIIVIVRIRNIF